MTEELVMFDLMKGVRESLIVTVAVVGDKVPSITDGYS